MANARYSHERWSRRATKRYALAVEGHPQQLIVRPGAGTPGGIKGVHVRGGPPGKLLHLALARHCPGGAGDGVRGGLGRTAGGLDRRQLAHPVGVLFFWQVQLRVRRVQVRRSRCPVGHPGHRHPTEHGHQAPLVTGFRTGPGGAVRAGHPGTALLPGCPEDPGGLDAAVAAVPGLAHPAAPPAPHASADPPPAPTATPPAPRSTPWTGQTPHRLGLAHTPASGLLLDVLGRGQPGT